MLWPSSKISKTLIIMGLLIPSEKSEADFRIQASEKFINSSIFNQRFTFLKNKSSFIFMLYFFMLY